MFCTHTHTHRHMQQHTPTVQVVEGLHPGSLWVALLMVSRGRRGWSFVRLCVDIGMAPD